MAITARCSTRCARNSTPGTQSSTSVEFAADRSGRFRSGRYVSLADANVREQFLDRLLVAPEVVLLGAGVPDHVQFLLALEERDMAAVGQAVRHVEGHVEAEC